MNGLGPRSRVQPRDRTKAQSSSVQAVDFLHAKVASCTSSFGSLGGATMRSLVSFSLVVVRPCNAAEAQCLDRGLLLSTCPAPVFKAMPSFPIQQYRSQSAPVYRLGPSVGHRSKSICAVQLLLTPKSDRMPTVCSDVLGYQQQPLHERCQAFMERRNAQAACSLRSAPTAPSYRPRHAQGMLVPRQETLHGVTGGYLAVEMST
ncbi:hypothetical protein ABIF74_008981 [Bradyrhizobium japonicum]